MDHWQDDAACSEIAPELWFPEGGASIAYPVSVCADCPVREMCLEFAMKNNIRDGIFGGVSQTRRRKMLAHAA